jgi:hypothetical protein
MPFNITLEPGERLIASLTFLQSGHGGSVFRLGVTDRAIFLPRKKIFAVKDPEYAERVPQSHIRELKIKRLSPYALWTVSALMVASGGWTTWLMIHAAASADRATVSGWPPAVFVVGLLGPFLIRRRYGLQITMLDEVFFWKPPFNVDTASKVAVNGFLSEVAVAIQGLGVRFVDERTVDQEVRARSRRYPIASRADETAVGVTRRCFHCARELRIDRWNDWNGFLFECAYCGQIHGKPWKPFPLMFGSIFLNAFSFLFTMRLRHAIPAVITGVIIFWAALTVATTWQVDANLELALMALAFLAPLVINGALLLRHESDLRSAVVLKSR